MQRSPEYPFISRPVADVPDVLTGPEIHIPRSAAANSNAKYILSKDSLRNWALAVLGSELEPHCADLSMSVSEGRPAAPASWYVCGLFNTERLKM